MEYKVIRSGRRSLAIEIKDNAVIVRAPYFVSQRKIDGFVDSHSDWIEKKLAEAEKKCKEAENAVRLNEDEISELIGKAKTVIPEKVKYFADLMGVTYGRITLRRQKTKWGSCSAAGNLNFNILLMLAPEYVLDSVIIHELCHRKEMNHSERFYGILYRYCPDYDKSRKWLKENAIALQNRI